MKTGIRSIRVTRRGDGCADERTAAKIATVHSKDRASRSHYNALAEKSASTQRRWEKSLLAPNNANRQWFPDDKLIARLPLDAQNAPVFNKSDRAITIKTIPERKFEVGFKEGSPRYVESPTGQGVAFDGKLYFDAGIRADFRYKSISKDYRERSRSPRGSILNRSRAVRSSPKSATPAEVENNVLRAEGYGLYFINGKIHFNMVFRWARIRCALKPKSLPPRQWRHIAVVFDGLKSWEDRLRIFVNGREAKLKFNQRNFHLLLAGPGTR